MMNYLLIPGACRQDSSRMYTEPWRV